MSSNPKRLAEIFLAQWRRVTVLVLLYILLVGAILAFFTQQLSSNLAQVLLSYQSNGIATEISARLKNDSKVDLEHLAYLMDTLPLEGDGFWQLGRGHWLEKLATSDLQGLTADEEMREIVTESLKLDSPNEVLDLETSLVRIREILWSSRVSHPGITNLQLILQLKNEEVAFLTGEAQPGFPDMSRSPHLESVGQSASFFPRKLLGPLHPEWPETFEFHETGTKLQWPIQVEGRVLGILRVQLSDRQAQEIVLQQIGAFGLAIFISTLLLLRVFAWLAASTKKTSQLWVAGPLEGLSKLLGEVDADHDGHIQREEIDSALPALQSFQEKLVAAREIQDITLATRQHLELLSHTLAENEAIQAKLKDALTRLEEASAVLVQSSKGWMMAELGAWVAHDLNNKLQGAYSISSNWIEREKPCPVKHLKFLHLSLEKALEQVDQFSQLSKPQSGQRVERITATDLFKDLKLLVSQRVQQADTTLEVELEEGLEYLDIPPGKVQDMLMNLVFNGCDAIVEKKEATGLITIQANSSMISVQDNGVGIADADQKELFNRPFFTTKSGSGTGLGLRIVASVASELGGKVECQSVLGEGSTFRVYFGEKHVSNAEPTEGGPLTEAKPHEK